MCSTCLKTDMHKHSPLSHSHLHHTSWLINSPTTDIASRESFGLRVIDAVTRMKPRLPSSGINILWAKCLRNVVDDSWSADGLTFLEDFMVLLFICTVTSGGTSVSAHQVWIRTRADRSALCNVHMKCTSPHFVTYQYHSFFQWLTILCVTNVLVYYRHRQDTALHDFTLCLLLRNFVYCWAGVDAIARSR